MIEWLRRLFRKPRAATWANAMLVPYKYLTAAECESLKQNARFDHPWGSYGPQGDLPMRFRSIADLDTAHLENILITQPQVPNEVAASILMLLKQRYQESLTPR